MKIGGALFENKYSQMKQTSRTPLTRVFSSILLVVSLSKRLSHKRCILYVCNIKCTRDDNIICAMYKITVQIDYSCCSGRGPAHTINRFVVLGTNVERSKYMSVVRNPTVWPSVPSERHKALFLTGRSRVAGHYHAQYRIRGKDRHYLCRRYAMGYTYSPVS